MKLTDYESRNSSSDQSSQLCALYLDHCSGGGDLSSFICQFDFDTPEDMAANIKLLVSCIAEDKRLYRADRKSLSPSDSAVFARFKKINEDQSRLDGFPTASAKSIWGKVYGRLRMEKRIAATFAEEPSPVVYANAVKKLVEVYGFSELDLEKLRFFVEQTKAGDDFPPSLRRVLYFWSEKNKTGKSTCANALTCILNGDTDTKRVTEYSSTLAKELGVESLSVPLVASVRCCALDEAFFADMSRMYAKFKQHITSTGGKARLPYGQEFDWKGTPNYVASSNDSASKIVADFQDRRFLEIEFKQPKVKLTFEAIFELWRQFCVHSTRDKDWSLWADEMYEATMVRGEAAEIADQYVIELSKTAFLNELIKGDDTREADGYVSVKTMKMLMSRAGIITQAEATSRATDARVKAATIAVFGETYSKTNYWRLKDMKAKANALLYANGQTATSTTGEQMPDVTKINSNIKIDF